MSARPRVQQRPDQRLPQLAQSDQGDLFLRQHNGLPAREGYGFFPRERL